MRADVLAQEALNTSGVWHLFHSPVNASLRQPHKPFQATDISALLAKVAREDVRMR